MVKTSRHYFGEEHVETERKPRSEVFFFLLAVLSPFVGLIAYTVW